MATGCCSAVAPSLSNADLEAAAQFLDLLKSRGGDWIQLAGPWNVTGRVDPALLKVFDDSCEVVLRLTVAQANSVRSPIAAVTFSSPT